MLVWAVISLLVFLFPLALYCLVLAYVNRSRRPVMVSGLWDSIGLLFALSGFLLYTAPYSLLVAAGLVIPIFTGTDPLVEWPRGVVLAIGYYLLVAAGAGLMVSFRRHKAVVYNVDTGLVRPRLTVAFAELGLDSVYRSGRFVIAPAESFTATHAPVPDAITAVPGLVHTGEQKSLTAAPGGPRYAELEIEPFVAACHVTLHWENYAPQRRREIEDRLEHVLEDAAAPDNPVAGWLLSFSGLVFFSITMLAAFVVVLRLTSRG